MAKEVKAWQCKAGQEGSRQVNGDDEHVRSCKTREG